jgi:hypothetical protein
VRRLAPLIAVLAALSASAATAAPSTGTLRVLVVPVTWGPQPFTQQRIDDVVLGTAADWLHRASFGRLTVTGTVLPWQPVLGAEVSCADRARIADLALAAARAAHVAPSAFDVQAFVLPALPQEGCAEHGFGSFGGSEIWLYGTPDWITAVHELGHTFGLDHGNSWACAGGACAGREYGDPYTVMGHGNGLFDAYDLLALGWIDTVARARDGTFQLGPIETAGPGPRALVVPTARNEYWIDHREPVGPDAGYGDAVARGVELHAEPNRTSPVAALRYESFADVLLPAGAGDEPWLLAPGRTFVLPGVFRIDALGPATVRFRWLDRTPPRAPVLDPIGRRAACRSHRLELTWSHASDAASGVAGYEVTTAGRRLARVADDFRFEPSATVALHGRLTAAVTAVDHAGNHSRPAVVRIACS